MNKIKPFQQFIKESTGKSISDRLFEQFSMAIEINDSIFEKLPEIKSIGSKEQYGDYLYKVFPNTKVKKVLFHGSPNKFDRFDRAGDLDGGYFGRGFYFTENMELAKKYQTRNKNEGYLYMVIVNLENPCYWKENQVNFQMNYFRKNNEVTIDKDLEPGWEKELVSLFNKTYGENINKISDLEYAEDINKLSRVGTEFLKSKGYDGSVAKNPLSKEMEFALFESDDIHILGSEKDVKGFKEYLKSIKVG